MSVKLRTVRVKKRFRASAERVFDAWLDAEKARQFLFVEGAQHVVRAEIDARVGGGFLFVARRDGADREHIGEYVEIERPRWLVFTLLVPSAWAEKTLVSVEIEALKSGCELTLTHEGVPEHLEGAVFKGWTAFLGGLGEVTKVIGAERKAK